jgi:hypothetical protein
MMMRLGATAHSAEVMQPRSQLGAPEGASFAELLDGSFRARAEQLGLDLPAAASAAPAASAQRDDVEAIWKRAQLQSAAINGPADAIMQSLSDAADARWEARREGSRRDLFSM